MPAYMAEGGGGGGQSMGSRPSGSMSSRPSQQMRPSGMAGTTRMRQSNVQNRLSTRFSTSDPSGAARASYAPRTSSLRPNLPQNLARDNGSVTAWGNDQGADAWDDARVAANHFPRGSNGSASGGNTRV
jgi:hypothetical protein